MGHADGNLEARQSTRIEGPIPDADQALGQRDLGQSRAMGKGLVPDGDDAGGDRKRTRLARGTQDQGRLSQVEQRSLHAAIGRIERMHRELRQLAAAMERPFPDAGNAASDGNMGQPGTIGKRLLSDPNHAIRNRDAGQAGAVGERFRSDGRYGPTIDDGRDLHVSPSSGILGQRHLVAVGRPREIPRNGRCRPQQPTRDPSSCPAHPRASVHVRHDAKIPFPAPQNSNATVGRWPSSSRIVCVWSGFIGTRSTPLVDSSFWTPIRYSPAARWVTAIRPDS